MRKTSPLLTEKGTKQVQQRHLCIIQILPRISMFSAVHPSCIEGFSVGGPQSEHSFASA